VRTRTLRARAEARYLKSELAFLGTGVPTARAVARSFTRKHTLSRPRLLPLVRALWGEPRSRSLHERRVVARTSARCSPQPT